MKRPVAVISIEASSNTAPVDIAAGDQALVVDLYALNDPRYSPEGS